MAREASTATRLLRRLPELDFKNVRAWLSHKDLGGKTMGDGLFRLRLFVCVVDGDDGCDFVVMVMCVIVIIRNRMLLSLFVFFLLAASKYTHYMYCTCKHEHLSIFCQNRFVDFLTFETFFIFLFSPKASS